MGKIITSLFIGFLIFNFTSTAYCCCCYNPPWKNNFSGSGFISEDSEDIDSILDGVIDSYDSDSDKIWCGIE